MVGKATTDKALVAGVVLALLVAGVGGAVPAAEPTDEEGQRDRTPVLGDERRDTGGIDRQQESCNYRQLYDRADQSVVVVQSANQSGPIGEGSGWVYNVSDSTALVVTNWHVVFNATEYDVQFNEGRWREAELVGASAWTDLAVLRVGNAPESATALELANRPAERGQPVAALGNPFGLEESISEGLVSGVDRAPTVHSRGGRKITVPTAIQTSSAVNPGNSGGPLVNCRGRVLGVNFAGVGQFDAGVNFAISARIVESVVPELVENGTYPVSFLGVRSVTVGPTLAEVNNLSATRGVMVTGVLPDGPAGEELRGAPAIHRRTGLPYDGDVLLAVEGTPIVDQGDLLTYLYLETRPNETVNFTVLRNGENQTVGVTLGARPEIPVRPREPSQTATPAPPTTTVTTEATGTITTETTGTTDTVTTATPPTVTTTPATTAETPTATTATPNATTAETTARPRVGSSAS